MTVFDWTLILMLLVSNVFWAYTTHKLVNKLMSRNYYEYQKTQTAFKKPQPPPLAPVQDRGPDDAEAQAQALNSIMGMS